MADVLPPLPYIDPATLTGIDFLDDDNLDLDPLNLNAQINVPSFLLQGNLPLSSNSDLDKILNNTGHQQQVSGAGAASVQQVLCDHNNFEKQWSNDNPQLDGDNTCTQLHNPQLLHHNQEILHNNPIATTWNAPSLSLPQPFQCEAHEALALNNKLTEFPWSFFPNSNLNNHHPTSLEQPLETATPRVRKPRKRKNPPTESQKHAKRQRTLERNRVAATKCRAKRKTEIELLKDRKGSLEIENGELKEQLRELQGQMRVFRQVALGHRECECEVREWVMERREERWMNMELKGELEEEEGMEVEGKEEEESEEESEDLKSNFWDDEEGKAYRSSPSATVSPMDMVKDGAF